MSFKEQRRAITSSYGISPLRRRLTRWPAGQTLRTDVTLWCTGFRSALGLLTPLMLREPGGGIILDGRLATRVQKYPRVHMVGYGPSASAIRAAAPRRTSLSLRWAFPEHGPQPHIQPICVSAQQSPVSGSAAFVRKNRTLASIFVGYRRSRRRCIFPASDRVDDRPAAAK